MSRSCQSPLRPRRESRRARAAASGSPSGLPMMPREGAVEAPGGRAAKVPFWGDATVVAPDPAGFGWRQGLGACCARGSAASAPQRTPPLGTLQQRTVAPGLRAALGAAPGGHQAACCALVGRLWGRVVDPSLTGRAEPGLALKPPAHRCLSHLSLPQHSTGAVDIPSPASSTGSPPCPSATGPSASTAPQCLHPQLPRASCTCAAEGPRGRCMKDLMQPGQQKAAWGSCRADRTMAACRRAGDLGPGILRRWCSSAADVA